MVAMSGAPTNSPLAALLTRLTRIDGVVAAALTTAEGLPVATTGRSDMAALADLRSATVAAIFGAVDRALPSLGLGQVHAATIETTAYSVYLCGLGDLVLSVVAERGAERNAVLTELARVAEVLSRVSRGAKGS
jgi:predicted regulator of Ras-like GTPase activity (Roadblock/LC7/MglB family)